MALPHMQPTYTLRRNVHEQSIVGRRNHESDFHQQWLKNAAFFHEGGVNAAKKKTWESDISFNNSLEKYKSSRKVESSALNMEHRKAQLRELFRNEKSYFEEELKELNMPMPSSRKDELIGRVTELRSSREEKRKQVAKQCLYQQWKQNNTKLQQVQSNLHTKHVTEQWNKQLELQKQLKEDTEAAEQKEDDEREYYRRQALDRDEHERLAVIHQAEQLASDQKFQIEELKRREQDTIEDKVNEKKLIQSQWKVAQIIREREDAEKSRQKLELGKVLLRQHGAALRRRSALIQEGLREDMKYLEMLSAQEQEDLKLNIARKASAQADVVWMKQVVADQLTVERERQIELENLYQDEATRMWEKRDQEWMRERQAREVLMAQVCDQRQQQVDANLDLLRDRQRDTLHHREQLLADLEQLQVQTSRQQYAVQEATTVRREELECQIDENRRHKESEKLQINLDLLNDDHVDIEEDRLIEQETQRMKKLGFQEQFQFRRRKNAWT